MLCSSEPLRAIREEPTKWLQPHNPEVGTGLKLRHNANLRYHCTSALRPIL